MRKLPLILMLILPGVDLAWNLTHLNIGLVDFHGLAAFARSFAMDAAWPATPYFPAGYPLLLTPFGYFGEWTGIGGILEGGYLLSAAGAGLTLWAIYRLGRLFGLSQLLCCLAIALVWLAPEFRVCAGSPSVDMLYTGLGAWFLAAAIAAWKGEALRWATLGLMLAPLALMLLRYHAIILILPVGLTLLFRARSRRAGALAVLACLLTFGFNHVSYSYFWHRPLSSVALLQVRTGLGLDYNRLQPSRTDFFENYAAFAEHARSTPILHDFSLAEIAAHTGKGLIQFLRRPAVLLMLGLLLLSVALKLRHDSAIWLPAIWVAAYCLALSPAYYTPRAAVLPSSISVLLVVLLTQRLGEQRHWKGLHWLTAALLLAGYCAASRFAIADYRERLQFWRQSRDAATWMAQQDLPRDKVLSLDSRIFPVRDNPWLTPFGRLRMSWLDDPEIDPSQLLGLQPYSAKDLLPGAVRRPAAVFAPEPLSIVDPDGLLENVDWEKTILDGGLLVYVPTDAVERDLSKEPSD